MPPTPPKALHRRGAAPLVGGAALAAVVAATFLAPPALPASVVDPTPVARPRAMAEHAANLATVAPPTTDLVELDGVADAPAASRRTVDVDLGPVIGQPDHLRVVYDVDAVTRPTTLAALRSAPDWVAGTRLLLGEIGIGRLRRSRWSVLEGVGILETVRNRLDPTLANPLSVRALRAWPGCGPGGTFVTCIDPEQYLGVDSTAALRPRDASPDARPLHEALDRAVAAWAVFELQLLSDVTAGATSFVHLCGGAAYGASTRRCDGGGDDLVGAEAHTGPILFRGPSVWLPRAGRYGLSVLGKVDYAEGPAPAAPRAFVDYLTSSDAAAYVDAAADSPAR